MTNEQLIQYSYLIERVARNLAWKFRPVVEWDDAAQIAALAALSIKIDERRSDLEIRKYIGVRVWGEAVDEIRRLNPGVRTRSRIRTITFSELERRTAEKFEGDRTPDDATAVIAMRDYQDDRRRRDRYEIIRDVAQTVVCSRCSRQQQAAFDEYFWRSKTMKEVGAVLGVGESRASQLLKEARDEVKPYLVAFDLTPTGPRPKHARRAA